VKKLGHLLRSKSGIRLDIGCGANKQEGFVGIDYRKLPGVDIVHNLEKFPYPLPDESVLAAVCSHVVEHINPHGGVFMQFMDEIWRVMKPKAQIAIATPYAGTVGYFQDPTHCNPCNELTWTYFDPLDQKTGGQLYRIYKPKPWKIEFSAYHKEGNMEVILSKRKEDKSYEN
jgi:SAM-dependent methyltransferase